MGLRGYYPDAAAFEWMRDNNFRFHTMAEIERRGWDAVMADVIREATEGPEYLFISFDVDTFDPAYAPGTGTPEPGGLTPREVFPIVRRLCAESNVVGFELVEFNPLVDPTYVSGMMANRVVRECLTGVAMRKMGITDPAYLSPLTVSHGQDGADEPEVPSDEAAGTDTTPRESRVDPIFGRPEPPSSPMFPMAVAFVFRRRADCRRAGLVPAGSGARRGCSRPDP